MSIELPEKLSRADTSYALANRPSKSSASAGSQSKSGHRRCVGEKLQYDMNGGLALIIRSIVGSPGIVGDYIKSRPMASILGIARGEPFPALG